MRRFVVTVLLGSLICVTPVGLSLDAGYKQAAAGKFQRSWNRMTTRRAEKRDLRTRRLAARSPEMRRQNRLEMLGGSAMIAIGTAASGAALHLLKIASTAGHAFGDHAAMLSFGVGVAAGIFGVVGGLIYREATGRDRDGYDAF